MIVLKILGYIVIIIVLIIILFMIVGYLIVKREEKTQKQAEKLLGMKLDLKEARQAKDENDNAELAFCINEQIGSYAKYIKLSNTQKEALAKAIGISTSKLIEVMIDNGKFYGPQGTIENSSDDVDSHKPFTHYIPKGQFIDDNDFLLKIIEIQNNTNNNSEKISYWQDYLKDRLENTSLTYENIQNFIKGKKCIDKDGNYEFMFNVIKENGDFNLHKAGEVGLTIEPWDHSEVTKTLYSGYKVFCEIGVIYENDDEFYYWDGFSFFPIFYSSRAWGLIANLPSFDEFEFQTGMTGGYYSFSKFCEFLSKIDVIDYNALDDERKQNLCLASALLEVFPNKSNEKSEKYLKFEKFKESVKKLFKTKEHIWISIIPLSTILLKKR